MLPACQTMVSTRKDPARSDHSKSKGHISWTMGVLHTALGHRSDGCIPCCPSKCPFICIHIGILSLRISLKIVLLRVSLCRHLPGFLQVTRLHRQLYQQMTILRGSRLRPRWVFVVSCYALSCDYTCELGSIHRLAGTTVLSLLPRYFSENLG